MSWIFDVGYELLSGWGGRNSFGSTTHLGVYDPTAKVSDKEIEPHNLSTVYTCARILSEAISMMPINTTKEGKEDREHKLYYNLRHRMSDSMNNQVFWSTIEYMRNIYGNAFVDKRKGKFDIIPIEVVEDWRYNNGVLEYELNWKTDKYINGNDKLKYGNREKEWIKSSDVLHFKSISSDGVMGLPPVMAAMQNLKIMDNATNTINAFYKNRAMSPLAVESTLPENAKVQEKMIESMERFKVKFAGAKNAGETVTLPPNTKLTPLQMHFADAELIATMRFSRDEIANLYGVPSFMVNSSESVQLDIEQMSKNFITFSLNPRTKIYEEELKYKLLSKDEVIGGAGVDMDATVLSEADLVTLSNSYAKFIQSGIMSPFEASSRLNFKPSDNPDSKEHYVQAQLVKIGSNPLEAKANESAEPKKVENNKNKE